MPALQVWPNPGTRFSAAAVDVGIVVSVRIWTSDKTGVSVLGPDANGVPPHLEYLATVEPDGTGAYQSYDPVLGIFGRETSERPTTSQSGQIVDQNVPDSPEAIAYRVDLGQPFLCPWPGQIFLVGGAWADVNGSPAPAVPYQVQVVRTMPQDVALGRELMIAGYGPAYRQIYRTTGKRTLKRNPRMTFLSLPTNAVNKIPRGAVAVYVPTATEINFYPSGSSTTVTIPPTFPGPSTITVPGGTWMPLGYLAEGYFAIPAGPAPLISFEVEIA